MARNNQDHVTLGDRTSICTWSLSFTFLLKFQAVEAVTKLMEYGIPCVDYREVMTGGSFEYTVTIPEMCWAHSLKEIAEILMSVDYPDTCGDYDEATEEEKSNGDHVEKQRSTIDRDAFLRP